MDDGGWDGDGALGEGGGAVLVVGRQGEGLEKVLAVQLDGVALVGPDEPLGRVGGGLVEVWVGGRVGLDGEALLVVVVDGVEDL